MGEIPRHLFIPPPLRTSAYDDSALPIGDGQTISQPYMVAAMTEKLELKAGERSLEIGTGSGYQAALLAELSKKVVTVERLTALSSAAEKRLKWLGYENIIFAVGDGTEGWRAEAPYDAIIVTAACPDIPPPLVEQLKEGGRLVLPVGDRFIQTLTLVRKKTGKISVEGSFGCVFVPLIGKYGFPD